MPLKRFSEKQLQMFFKKIFYAIITIVQFFKSMFEYKDYYIKKADFVYTKNEIKLLDNVTKEYREGGPKKIVDEMAPDVVDFLFSSKKGS